MGPEKLWLEVGPLGLGWLDSMRNLDEFTLGAIPWEEIT
jgi:hypothetical protein